MSMPTGQIFVADPAANTVTVYSADGNKVRSIRGECTAVGGGVAGRGSRGVDAARSTFDFGVRQKWAMKCGISEGLRIFPIAKI